jgi:hypothetical protein
LGFHGKGLGIPQLSPHGESSAKMLLQKKTKKWKILRKNDGKMTKKHQ